MEAKLKNIFEKHGLVLVDNNEYNGEREMIPKSRIVSYKWLARLLRKEHDDE